MPKIIKKKAVKKVAAQEEEVRGFALEALDVIKERQKQLTIAAVAAAVLMALYMTVSMYTSSLTHNARDVEMTADDYLYSEGADSSLPDDVRLKKAVEMYMESLDIKVTPTALYNLGNSYYRLGDYANAIEQYDLFIDEFSDIKEMIPLVHQKLASSYMMAGQSDKAFAALQKLSQIDNGIFRDTALVLEARYLESAGEADKAIEKYRELAAEFPVSAWSMEAASKIPSAEEKETVEVESEAAAEVKKEENK